MPDGQTLQITSRTPFAYIVAWLGDDGNWIILRKARDLRLALNAKHSAMQMLSGKLSADEIVIVEIEQVTA
jgi:hypothetical protein